MAHARALARLQALPPMLAAGAITAAVALLGSLAPSARPAASPATVSPRAARLRVFVHDPSGAPLHARVRVVEIGGDARRAAVARDGEAALTLAPGRWRVTVSRGPERSIDRRVVALRSGREATVEARLRRVLDPGEHVPCDLHVHAAPSADSEVSLDARVRSLAAEGIRFAVATDHNHVTDYRAAAEAAGLRDLGTAPGVEVTTWEPSFGHFNAWPLAVDRADRRGGAPAFSGTSPAALFDALHALGPDVVVQINHPRLDDGIGYLDRVGFDPARGTTEGKASFAADAVEVWNGYELRDLDALDANLRDWMALVGAGHRLVATGSSDSHDLHRHPAGYPRTYVRVPGGRVDDPARVAAALRAGHAFVSSGPLLEVRANGAGPGEVARHDGVVRLEVTARTPAWMRLDRLEVWLGGARIRDEALPPAPARDGARAWTYRSSLEVHEPTFVVVRVRGPATPALGARPVPPVAFGNPVWLRVEGAQRVRR
ncbi:MAG TPA: CehA/McbA family metallohydrolase [Sandaracinaceae bacterium LLY-WYZ-13_1]|nr:CehA/McbA family metallohydrolase [Sandaracinaceae bacterium LLY-WYZ-13_1]